MVIGIPLSPTFAVIGVQARGTSARRVFEGRRTTGRGGVADTPDAAREAGSRAKPSRVLCRFSSARRRTWAFTSTMLPAHRGRQDAPAAASVKKCTCPKAVAP